MTTKSGPQASFNSMCEQSTGGTHSKIQLNNYSHKQDGDITANILVVLFPTYPDHPYCLEGVHCNNNIINMLRD